MIYALCFDTNTVHCFRSEREASEYCKAHAGDWQLCDGAGKPVYPPGFAPRMHAGLLAAHLWLADAHDGEWLAQHGYDLQPGLLHP
ncbi:hypothetical protein [Chitinimonas naiadis]